MNFILYVSIALSVITAFVAMAIVSFHIGRARGCGEVFHVRMEAAQARRRMHELTREAFVAILEAAGKKESGR